MRDFAYKPQINDDPIDVPTDVEGHPVYQESVFDSVQFDELEDGSYIQNDMTSILLNQEKYRRLLGDMNVNNILAQMHPTQSTVMSILNLILISYIGCSYMSLSSSVIGICLPSVLILVIIPIVFGLSLKQV
jgi:hypothetical protein